MHPSETVVVNNEARIFHVAQTSSKLVENQAQVVDLKKNRSVAQFIHGPCGGIVAQLASG